MFDGIPSCSTSHKCSKGVVALCFIVVTIWVLSGPYSAILGSRCCSCPIRWVCWWTGTPYFSHCSDVIMSAMASQITGGSIACSTVCSAQIKENSKAPRHWPLWWEFTGDRWIPARRASNAENVSVWWRYHGDFAWQDKDDRISVWLFQNWLSQDMPSCWDIFWIVIHWDFSNQDICDIYVVSISCWIFICLQLDAIKSLKPGLKTIFRQQNV